MNKKSIAVVMPVYNAEHTVAKSLQSLINQDFKNWICIVVNDGSTDCTLSCVIRYAEVDDRIIIISYQQNKGRGYARRVALEKVQELAIPYMCMLDAEDLYYPDKLQWQYQYMEANPDICLMSCSMGLIDDELNLTGVLEPFSEEITLCFTDYRKYLKVPHASSIIRTSCIGKETFDERMLLGQDQDFMIRILKDKKYTFIPKIGYLYSREYSFSIQKYRVSQKYGLYSKKKLKLSKSFLLRYRLTNLLKLGYVFLLSLFKKEKKYFEKITRSPFVNELKLHSKTQTSLSK